MTLTVRGSLAVAGSPVVDISTQRLQLRPMQLSDAPALHAFFSDPVAMEFWSPVHAAFADTERWVRGTVTSPPDQTREFAICHGGTVIGKAGIWKRPEIGYFLARPFWGQGLMTEALEALIPHLHAAMSLEVITAEVTPDNAASVHVLTKTGFVQTRLGSKDYWDGTKWVDTGYYEHRIP